jgi:hypothetical protein
MKLFIFFSIGAMIGWNIFLIQRDQKLYDVYYGESYSEVRK